MAGGDAGWKNSVMTWETLPRLAPPVWPCVGAAWVLCASRRRTHPNSINVKTHVIVAARQSWLRYEVITILSISCIVRHSYFVCSLKLFEVQDHLIIKFWFVSKGVQGLGEKKKKKKGAVSWDYVKEYNSLRKQQNPHISFCAYPGKINCL